MLHSGFCYISFQHAGRMCVSERGTKDMKQSHQKLCCLSLWFFVKSLLTACLAGSCTGDSEGWRRHHSTGPAQCSAHHQACHHCTGKTTHSSPSATPQKPCFKYGSIISQTAVIMLMVACRLFVLFRICKLGSAA